ncbi:hypothetical protein ELI_3988 [Eubacterium callanderi]|uniref:Uncharacterized protein n=1 Tax=Eubacterium callanderi TaxID=53442 RepID=E3GGX7_9FIRM|nr:hypothetical protein ELI_3988 [Eubacterium callanderi]
MGIGAVVRDAAGISALFSQTKLIQSGYTRERRKMKGVADGV